jgi:hypothetical protein
MELQVTWKARGSGWVCDQTQLVDVCFADDVILFSNIRDDLARMLVETRDAFRSVGLDAGMGKNIGSAGHENRVRPYALIGQCNESGFQHTKTRECDRPPHCPVREDVS